MGLKDKLTDEQQVEVASIVGRVRSDFQRLLQIVESALEEGDEKLAMIRQLFIAIDYLTLYPQAQEARAEFVKEATELTKKYVPPVTPPVIADVRAEVLQGEQAEQGGGEEWHDTIDG
jgi:leucyl-tRNA synthetase